MIKRWARFVVIAILYAACGHLAPLPGLLSGPGLPGNLYCARVDASGKCDVYRGAQFSEAEGRGLHDQLGVRSVLKLNTALEGRDEVPAGVELIEHPMSSVLGPRDAAEAERICEDVDAAPKPLYIHCTEGRERTGWAVARCLRLRQRPIAPSADAIYNEWIAHGMRPWLASGLIQDFDRASGYQRRAIAPGTR